MDYKKFTLRIPEKLHDDMLRKLKIECIYRSKNTYILECIQKCTPKEKKTS